MPVISAGISFVVSLSVSLIVAFTSHTLSKRRKKSNDADEWLRDVNRAVNRLHRQALALEPGITVEEQELMNYDSDVPQLQSLATTVEDLETLSDDPISEEHPESLKNSIDDLISWFRSPNYQYEELNTTLVQQKVLTNVEDIKKYY